MWTQENVGRAKSEVLNNAKEQTASDGGRNTPNSLAAAWRNSYTLRKSMEDLNTMVGAAAPAAAEASRSRSESQFSGHSAGGKRLPLSLPHVQQAYAPYMVYDPSRMPVRPWSTCGYAQPWPVTPLMPAQPQPLSPLCNGKAEMATTEKVDKDLKRVKRSLDHSDNSRLWSTCRPLQMLSILQLVLSVAILTAGIIRAILGAYTAVCTEVTIGLFMAITQVVAAVGIQKRDRRLLLAGFIGSIIECSVLALPIFACIQSLQSDQAIHRHVVSVFVVALCCAQLGVVATQMGYTCYAMPTLMKLFTGSEDDDQHSVMQGSDQSTFGKKKGTDLNGLHADDKA